MSSSYLGYNCYTHDLLQSRQVLRVEVRGLRKQTVLQTTSLVERRTTLIKHIQRFREIQRLHMPEFDASTYAQTVEPSSASSTNAEDSILWLPSDLSIRDRRRYCSGSLAEMEDRLRFAEATDTLESLRHHLRTRSFANRFKIANVTGQVHNTRAREHQHHIDDNVRAAELQYCRARKALLELRGNGDWENALKILHHSDVRALNERQLNEQEKEDIRRVRERGGGNVDSIDEERVIVTAAAVGEGQRRPSWIWFSGNEHENMQDPLTKMGKYNLSHYRSILT